MDGPPAQSLGVEPIDHDVLKQPPRSATDRILNRHLLGNVLLSALVIVSGTSLVFWYELKDYHVNARDTTLTFTAFVLFDMFNALSCRSQTKSIFRVGFTTNRMFLIAVGLSLLAQLLVIYAPPLQAVFVTEPLSLSDILMLVALTSSVFIVSEIKKYIENRMRWNSEHITTKRKTKKSIISRIFKSKNRQDVEHLPENVV